MLSKTIFVAASFFLAVTAVPTPADVEVEARNAPPPPPPACGSTLKAQCCDSVTKTLIGLLNIPVGVGCVDVIGTGACSQQTACCAPGNQIGLVNVALPVCPILL